jgi:septal ring factor EnvC (AmiA/AmiB activator)
MAVSLVSLIPWADVISKAPDVLQHASKLWTAVANRRKPAAALANTPEVSPETSAVAPPPALASRVQELEASVLALDEQMNESAGVIKQLAEQNSTLISALERALVEVQAQVRSSEKTLLGLSDQLVQSKQAAAELDTKVRRIFVGLAALAVAAIACILWLVTRR